MQEGAERSTADCDILSDFKGSINSALLRLLFASSRWKQAWDLRSGSRPDESKIRA